MIETLQYDRSVPKTSPWLDWMRDGAWEPGIDAALPMLPSVATEVLQLAMDPEVPAHRISMIVAKNPVLAGSVIALANSAFSASVTEISSINAAVVRMGTAAVRNIVVAQCLSARMQDPKVYGRRGKEIVDHAIGTAYLAWSIADQAGESPDEAFLYGLLHDIGKLLILRLADGYRNNGGVTPTEDDIEAVIVEMHAHFSGYLATRWQLPQGLQDPLVWHHQPHLAHTRPAAARIAYCANRLAHRYHFGCEADPFDPLEDAVFLEIGFDAHFLAQLDSHAPGLYDVARRITS
jgi:HD-like signal output (HDOD) protein